MRRQSRHREQDANHHSHSLVNIFSDATQYQQQPPLFDDRLCHPNYLQRQYSSGTAAGGGEGGGSYPNMTAGSFVSSNHGSPPSSPPMDIPPPPRPPLSRAPSLGGSIGRASGYDLRHNSIGCTAASGVSGCPKCRFATIATPTHNNRHPTAGAAAASTATMANGSVAGNNYSHLGYHHQNHHQRQGLMAGSSQHYGSSNSHSGEWTKRTKFKLTIILFLFRTIY